MTFDDDMFVCGGMRATLKSLGLTWPPPEFIIVKNRGELPDTYLRRVSYSAITDKQRADMSHVCRGAQYELCAASEAGHG